MLLKKIFALAICISSVVQIFWYQAKAAELKSAYDETYQEIALIFEGVEGVSSQSMGALTKVFQLLPEEHQALLAEFDITPDSSSARGRANHDTILMNPKNIETNAEFVAVFLHEIGHLVDLNLVRGLDGKDNHALTSRFQSISWEHPSTIRKGRIASDFVSGYAQENAYEDFAESYLFYLIGGRTFRDITVQSPDLYQKYFFIRNRIFKGVDYGLVIDDYAQNFDATLLVYHINQLIDSLKVAKEQREIIARVSYSSPPRYTRVRN